MMPWTNINHEAMKYREESLQKLVELIIEISSKPENLWFKDALLEKLVNLDTGPTISENSGFDSYFKLLKKQFKIKANNLYKDIPDKTLKSDLINDCVKMYWFQINNEVQSMFIQAFSQMENMLNFYVAKSNAFEKIEKNRNHYQHYFNEKFNVVCYNGFYSNSLPKQIVAVNIWSKLVFWAYDTKHSEFLISNSFNFSNLINIRNDNIHKDSISEKKSFGFVTTFKKEDYSAFSFYINILKEISKTLQNIESAVHVFPFEHTKITLAGPKIIGKIDLDKSQK